METSTSTITRPSPAAMEALADEIAILSATITAATCRLLQLIGEYDRLGGWADPLSIDGFRSCAHWLSWRVGFDLGTARQYVRVARALPSLPRISAAFERGEVSYSKVRAITRIATPENEETLLGFARAGTASHVEKIVRSFRRANRAEESERAVAQQAARSLCAYWDRDGMLVLRGRLSPEQGAVLLKALEVAGDQLRADERDSAETSATGSGVEDGAAESSATASGLEDGSAETSKRVQSAHASRPNEANPGQRQADALAWLADRALGAAAAESDGAASDRFLVVVHVDAEVLADPDADGRCELEDGPAIAAETARRLACDRSVVVLKHGPEGQIEAGRRTRAISAPLRRALRARDGTRCAFPGCTCRAREGHHVEHWGKGGPTVLQNLLGLCRFHHTCVHEGGIRVEALEAGRFRFLRRDGRELAAAPPLPVMTAEDPEVALVTRWTPDEVRLGPDSLTPTWAGETCDYHWAVEDLQLRAQGAFDRSPGW